jgi:hypothetical protein
MISISACSKCTLSLQKKEAKGYGYAYSEKKYKTDTITNLHATYSNALEYNITRPQCCPQHTYTVLKCAHFSRRDPFTVILHVQINATPRTHLHTSTSFTHY